MTIKRFGVQLAASGVVILLGALGVTQAQRESGKIDTTQWDLEAPPAMGPPAPIAADGDAASLSHSSLPPSSHAPSGPPDYAALAIASTGDAAPPIRRVNHEESFALPPQSYVAEQMPATDDSAADGPSGFALPGWSTSSAAANSPPNAPPTTAAAPNAASLPATGYGLPGITPGDETYAADPLAAAADESSLDASAAPPSIGPVAAIAMGAVAIGTAALGNDDRAAPASNAYAAAPQSLQYDDSSVPETAATDAAAFNADPADTGPVNGLRSFGSSDSIPAADPANDPRSFQADTTSPPQFSQPQFATIESPAESGDLEASSAPYSPQPQGFAAGPNTGAFAVPSQSPQTQLEQTQSPPSQLPQGYEGMSGEPAFAAAPPIARIASASATLPALGDLEIADDLVLNEPGDRRLDGMQSPSIVIHKRAPEQVKVGKPATFVIQVQNVGGVEAMGVAVHDRVPAGMRLIDATPQPQMQGDLLLWQLGALEPGGERTISLQLVPEQEGELGSVARVTFEAAASVRTFSTRPALKISQRAPAQVLIGQQLEIELEVTNPGTGVATGVILQADVPDGLEHPKGRQLDNLIGTLAPGETRRQVLRLRAVGAGLVQNQVRLVGDDDLTASDIVDIQVIAPQLAIELEGPTRRFLERQATYQINLANVGTAEATNVEVVAFLDRGFSFVGTEFQGQYDPARHAVYWSLAELPADARGAVPLTLLPIEQGERAIRLEARGDLNLIARHEKKVNIDALAELTFSITDDADPIEVGSVATYEIRIVNRGSRDDADIKLKLQLPPGLELVSSESDASTDGRGMVIFAPQSVMAARSETVHRVRVKGTAPGTHVVKAIIASSQAPVAVTKEESTTVYADE